MGLSSAAPEDGEQVTKSLQHKGGQQGGKLRETKSVFCYLRRRRKRRRRRNLYFDEDEHVRK